MTMEFALKMSVLQAFVNILASVVDEFKVVATAEGWRARAVDPAHVAMVDINLPWEAFGIYKIKDGETTLGLDVDKIKEVLKLQSNEDDPTIRIRESVSIDGKDTGHILVSVGNVTRKMPLIDTAGFSDPKIPVFNLAASVDVPVSEVLRGLKAAKQVSDHIAVVLDPQKGFAIIGEGDTDSSELIIPADDDMIRGDFTAKEKVRSLFPLDYLNNMVGALPANGGKIHLEVGNDYPVRMTAAIPGGPSVRMLLAPRIEAE